ncbi:MAG: glycoside hydrolase family 3 C-terminal domain-containing protein [candidate division KSB1 bacterium]|nr:glycoside hydrolase family 3 C-terminal domain-containing protein [candidate division KSB1 bacterium]
MDTDAMASATTAAGRERMPYKDPTLPIEERVSDLLGRMSLEEKVAQMLCIWSAKGSILFDERGELSFAQLRKHLPHGLGQIARLSDTRGGLSPREMMELANQVQKFFVEHTRLCIPVILHEECLHGLAAKDATSYPQAIALASTFDPALVERVFAAVAEDVRSRGAHQVLAPVVDVARDPRWGRVEETFGEDPYLVAQMGLAAVRGLQGDGSFSDGRHVMATLKHFAAHGQPESGINCAPAIVSERLLRDVFLYPFKQVVQKGKVASIMASYNEIDGVPSHANRWLLRDVLRGEWGFKGFVVSDYFAITELHHRPEAVSHSVAGDKKEAALLAACAGVNIELPDMDCYPLLVELVREGKLSEAVIDELVAQLLSGKFTMGLFDRPFVAIDEHRTAAKLEADRELALQAAREAIILLKNEGNLLPLRPKRGTTIAVIGPNADRELLGGYSGKPRYYTSVLSGIKEKVGSRCRILYAEGCKITVGGSWHEDTVTLPDPEEDRQAIVEAVRVAQQADVIILALGGNEQTAREAWNRFHLGDRASLELVGRQNELAEALLRTGKPVVVVLSHGRPNSINFIAAHVPAIVECWYLGQETGHAIADVLFGDYNPGGKLPISVPRSAGHIPCYYNYKPSARRGYLFDDVSPLYPFGYGLSYSTFTFRNVRLERSTIRLGESTKVVVEVTNTGGCEGEEVVQMYVRDLVSSVTRPIKELRGFRRVHLKPGQSATISFPVGFEELAFTNIDKELTVEPGDFEIMVGSSSRDEDLSKVLLHVVRG